MDEHQGEHYSEENIKERTFGHRTSGGDIKGVHQREKNIRERTFRLRTSGRRGGDSRRNITRGKHRGRVLISVCGLKKFCFR